MQETRRGRVKENANTSNKSRLEDQVKTELGLLVDLIKIAKKQMVKTLLGGSFQLWQSFDNQQSEGK